MTQSESDNNITNNVATGRNNASVLPWLVLVFGIVTTSLLYNHEMKKDQQAMRAVFDNAVENITVRMQMRIKSYQQVLRGVSGLIAADEEVTRSEFNRYVSSLKFEENYPGILALSFNLRVLKAEKDAHIAAVRESGIPGYAIKPEGDRDSYSPVLFIEPMTAMNQQALGYDTYVDVLRRAAMMKASDSGKATLTAKIELQQQGAGALLFLPIYSKGTPAELLEEHRDTALGWAVAVFQIQPMMDGMLSSILGEYDTSIDVEIYDGEMPSVGALLYDRDGIAHIGSQPSVYKNIRYIKFGERTWSIQLSSLPIFEARSQKAYTTKLVFGSAVLSLLLTLLAFLLLNNHKRAVLRTMHMTTDLDQLVIREREQRAILSATLDTVIDAVITIDEKGTIESFNLSAIKIFGYQPEEVIGKNVSILMPQPYRDEHDGYLSRFLEDRTPHVIGIGREVVGLRKDGSEFPMELSVNDTMLDDRQTFTGVVRDISERKRIENELLLSKQQSEASFDYNVVRVLDALSRGDLTQKIVLGNPDETARHRDISENLNTMVDQLNRFSEEVTRVAREVGTEGTLGGQAEVPGVDGTWKELTDNVNAMANNLTSQVRNIADVTTAVAKGDLTRKITVDARGEVLELKNTINEMVDQLNRFSEEVTRVAREVGTEGTLGGQAEVPGVDGTWKELTDIVNAMANNLTAQVRNIADVTTAVAKGDLTRKITVDARGEVLELKNTINEMVDQLNRFSEEVTRVAREVGTEGTLGGQAEVPGVDGTWKELTDIVNAMANNLTTQVRSISEVTRAVAKGDLTQEITVNVKGEVLELKNDINTMISTLSTERDIRDQAEASLVVAMEEAEAASRTQSDFLANMSHEIRTPMNAILGMSRLCLKTDLSDKQREYISKVDRSAQGLLGVINDILDFSKIDAGMLILEQAHFALKKSIDLVDSSVGYLAHTKDLGFETSVSPDVPEYLVGDQLRLGQVLLNLASNAVKFTSVGRVKVSVALKEANEQSVELEFRVIDTGIGLTPGQAEGLFDAFSQVDTSTTRKFGGTGLGLAISKRLVELMGGRIWIESEVGVGSTFCFTACFGHGEASQAVLNGVTPELPASAMSLLKGARILVAEDNEINQDLIEELLEQRGVEVQLCGNGLEVLEKLAKEHFDIVLMDVQMPVMDGYEATRQIRATPELAGQRVIAMTANAMAVDRERCLEAGMDDFETKPIDAEHLYQTLIMWLPERSEAVGVSPIDLTVLGQLLNHDPAKIASFAQKFVSTSRVGLTEMQAAYESGDLELLAGLCHKQKSAASSVGARSSTALYKALEDASKAGDRQQVQALLTRLPPLLEQIALQIGRETG